MRPIQNKWKKGISGLLLLTLLTISANTVYASENLLPSGIPADRIGEVIENYVDENAATTAGMAVSVLNAEGTVYKNYFGYADIENGIAVDENTVFEWGSATKMLVWVSVMQLYEQGLIDLDADIRGYLPDGFLTKLHYDTPITMIHLMNHTAGFQELYTNLFVRDADITAMKSLEAALREHEPAQIYEPGTCTAYSNWGVALAAYIVECISGERFDDYVHEHIFKPLGMEQSALAPDLSDNAYVYEKRRELQCYTTEAERIPDCYYYLTIYPSGMCTSTLTDFETFAGALLNRNSALFQSENTWMQMFTPTNYYGDTDLPVNYHGFWMIPFGIQTIGHGGNTTGCSSYMLISVAENIGVVVMTNQAYEEVYNEQMMSLIFGTFSEAAYFDSAREMPSGIFRSARTIRVGPMKMSSLSFLYGEWGMDECWDEVNTGSIHKICSAYEDYIEVSKSVFIGETALFVLQIAAFAFSLLSALMKGIRLVIYKVRHRKPEIVLGKWSACASGLQLLGVILLMAAVLKVSKYAVASTYAWMFGAIGLLGIAMAVFAVYGVAAVMKTKSSIVRKIYNSAVIFFLIVTIVNIGYWNIFMFWAL